MKLMADQGERSRSSQQEMLNQLREMSQTIRSSHSLEWNPVTFKVTEGSAEGAPLEGVMVILNVLTTGGPNGSSQDEVGERKTDRAGTADFGVVRPGHYSYQVVRPWREGSAAAVGQFKVEPGSTIEQPIVCPRVPLEKAQVHIRWAWPADLAREELALYATFGLNPIETGNLRWAISDQRPPYGPHGQGRSRWARQSLPSALTRSVLCGPGAAVAQSHHASSGIQLWVPEPLPLRRLAASLPDDDLRPIKDASSAIQLEAGHYTMTRLLVMRPRPDGEGLAGKRRFEVLVASQALGFDSGSPWWIWSGPPDDEADNRPATKDAPVTKRGRRRSAFGQSRQMIQFGNLGNSPVALPWESWAERGLPFDANPGKVSEWTMPMPDELVAAVRRQLESLKNPPKPDRVE